jgi:hypothetical protein
MKKNTTKQTIDRHGQPTLDLDNIQRKKQYKKQRTTNVNQCKSTKGMQKVSSNIKRFSYIIILVINKNKCQCGCR